MGRLQYDGRQWSGVSDDASGILCVSMSDAIFQQHLNTYLQSIGVPTETYLELLQRAEWVCEQRYKAIQRLSDLEYWRHYNAPDVRIVQYKRKNVAVKPER